MTSRSLASYLGHDCCHSQHCPCPAQPAPPPPPPPASDCLEALYNGGGCEWVCREAFWKHRPCSQTSCVLQCYLQNRKLCPIFATHILCLRVHGGAGAGHFSGAGRELFRQPGEAGVLSATRKNKQTIFAKIIHVADSLVVLVFVSPTCWYPQQGPTYQVKGFLPSSLSFLFSKWRRLSSVTPSTEFISSPQIH